MRRLFLFAACLSGPAWAQGDTADVLVRPVARGAILSPADFEARAVTPMLARGALRARDAAGLAATRNLMAGSTVRVIDLAPPALVRRGDAVSVELRTGALLITAPGRALADGAKGAGVRVVNLATNRTLDAIVDGPGKVRVIAP